MNEVYKITREELEDIADSIRDKTGKNNLMMVSEMPGEIASISGEGGGGSYSQVVLWDSTTSTDASGEYTLNQSLTNFDEIVFVGRWNEDGRNYRKLNSIITSELEDIIGTNEGIQVLSNDSYHKYCVIPTDNFLQDISSVVFSMYKIYGIKYNADPDQPQLEPLIPIMTSVSTPEGLVESGNYYGYGQYGRQNIWNAFDGDNSTFIHYQSENVDNGFISYEFSNDRLRYVAKIIASFGNYLANNSFTATLYVYDENDDEIRIETVNVTGLEQPDCDLFTFNVNRIIKKLKFVFSYKNTGTNIFTYDIQAYGYVVQ